MPRSICDGQCWGRFRRIPACWSTSAVISFCIRSAMPGNIEVPPDRTVFAYRSFRKSTSHFMIELYVVSWIPHDSIPATKRSFRKRSEKGPASLKRNVTWGHVKNCNGYNWQLSLKLGAYPRARLEHCFGAAEALVPDRDHLPVQQLVGLLQWGTWCRRRLLEIHSNVVAQLLFDVPDDLALRWNSHFLSEY